MTCSKTDVAKIASKLSRGEQETQFVRVPHQIHILVGKNVEPDSST